MSPDPIDLRLSKPLAELTDICLMAAQVVSRGRDHFDSDELLRLASEAVISRLGEAVNRLPESFRQRHPSQRWSAMKGIRNLVAHDYARIDHDIIWNAFVIELPKLREFLDTHS